MLQHQPLATFFGRKPFASRTTCFFQTLFGCALGIRATDLYNTRSHMLLQSDTKHPGHAGLLSRIGCVLLLGLMFSGQVLASNDPYAQARKIFDRAHDLALGGHFSSISASDLKILRDYPLYSYIEAAHLSFLLRTQPSRALDKLIASHVEKYPYASPSYRLRTNWIASLYVRRLYSDFLKQYRESDNDRMDCRAVNARIKLGQIDKSLVRDAKALWLYGKSRPKECDPVFKWLKDSGRMNSKLIFGRFRKALEVRNLSLAKYLTRSLSTKNKKRANRWIQLYRNPFDELTKLSKKGDSSVDAEMITFAFERAAPRDPERAEAILPGLLRLYAFSKAQRAHIQRFLGYRFALNRNPQSIVWFLKAGEAGEIDDKMHEWRIRSALNNRAWKAALDWVQKLPAEVAEQPRWQYWHARSLAKAGKKAEAEAIYKKLADGHGYYEYLSVDRLGLQYQVKDRPVPRDDEAQKRVNSHPVVLRARELIALGKEPQARVEWTRLARDGNDPALLRRLAVTAQSWDWHYTAIYTLVKADYWGDLKLRYPMPHRKIVEAVAKEVRADPAWIFGIMRSESLFLPQVRSPVGAMGLMQLMPATARAVGKRNGIRYKGRNSVLQPDINIRLGGSYLAEMLKRFDGHYGMASAAYNAGPHRVKKWLPEQTLPADIWVENIPFNETRTYVTRVMTHTTAYQWRMGMNVTPLSIRMPPVRPDADKGGPD